MLIDINQNRYERISRHDVLALLTQAQLIPDELTVHRDRSFTAFYQRERLRDVFAAGYEARMEAIDYRIAIFKRPSTLTDKGKYITLKFAVASAHALGIAGRITRSDVKDETSSTALLNRLTTVSHDMRQLVAYAHDIAGNGFSHKHLAITLDELQKQIDVLAEGLKQLAVAHQKV